jgi:hypothetical protein
VRPETPAGDGADWADEIGPAPTKVAGDVVDRNCVLNRSSVWTDAIRNDDMIIVPANGDPSRGSPTNFHFTTFDQRLQSESVRVSASMSIHR